MAQNHVPAKPIGAPAVALNAPPQPRANPTRHPHRTTPSTITRRRQKKRIFSCRHFLCIACFWSIIVLIALLLIAAISGAAFYVIYHPHYPVFSVDSVKISVFNLTTTPSDDTTHLSTRINLTLSARNPNNKITFSYDPISISLLRNSIVLANGSFPNFTASPGSIQVIHTKMGVDSEILDGEFARSLASDLKNNKGMPMEIHADTMVGVKVEKLKMNKVGIRVACGGIRWRAPRGRYVTSTANTDTAKCKVDMRIKIFKLFSF